MAPKNTKKRPAAVLQKPSIADGQSLTKQKSWTDLADSAEEEDDNGPAADQSSITMAQRHVFKKAMQKLPGPWNLT